MTFFFFFFLNFGWLKFYICVHAHARKPRVCGCLVHDLLELELQVATVLGLELGSFERTESSLNHYASSQCPALLHSGSPCVVQCFSRLPRLQWNSLSQRISPSIAFTGIRSHITTIPRRSCGLNSGGPCVPSQTSVLNPQAPRGFPILAHILGRLPRPTAGQDTSPARQKARQPPSRSGAKFGPIGLRPTGDLGPIRSDSRDRLGT